MMSTKLCSLRVGIKFCEFMQKNSFLILLSHKCTNLIKFVPIFGKLNNL